MNLLLIAATDGEINRPLPASIKGDWSIEVLVTGVGMVATTYALTKHIQHNKYDFVMQVGVAGSFYKELALGDVVFITEDRYADFGAEDHDKHLDIFEMGLQDKNTFPFSNGKLVNPLSHFHDNIKLPRVSGITVNTVSGNAQTIKMRSERYNAMVESMEGAAFHEVCLRENIPFAQVRAISNYVTPRDKSQWKMKEAVINLNDWLAGFINTL
ncbi:MAG: mqnB [Flavipsychrobacter sp.]|jgi:futalosine hydrolase|nr:mqnB [Flavipsychrobacter sp.]